VFLPTFPRRFHAAQSPFLAPKGWETQSNPPSRTPQASSGAAVSPFRSPPPPPPSVVVFAEGSVEQERARKRRQKWRALCGSSKRWDIKNERFFSSPSAPVLTPPSHSTSLGKIHDLIVTHLNTTAPRTRPRPHKTPRSTESTSSGEKPRENKTHLNIPKLSAAVAHRRRHTRQCHYVLLSPSPGQKKAGQRQLRSRQHRMIKRVLTIIARKPG